MSKKTLKAELRRPRYSLFDPIENQVAPRVLLVEFFYWPFLTIDLKDVDPLAVVEEKGIVTHVSPRALKVGVRVGDKVRASLGVVPELLVISPDAIDQGGLFSKVANVLEQFSPLVEIIEPGVCATNSKGPSKYFGGEEELVAQVKEAISNRIIEMFGISQGARNTDIFDEKSIFSFGVSIADGIFTARIAARDSSIIPPGGSGPFLAPFPAGELPNDKIVDILGRLGVHLLGEFVSLDFNLVMDRFGLEGAILHRMANGLDTSALEPSRIKEDFTQKVELEEPLEVASAVIFACRTRVEEMLSSLLDKGYLCQIMRVNVTSDNGEESIREWGIKDGFSAQLLLERIRWQLESWSSDPKLAPTSGVVMVELIPKRVVSVSQTQLDLDGTERSSLTKVSQALSRVDSITGKRSSFAKIKGSRTAKGSVEMVPWQLYLFDLEAAADKRRVEPPWPGRLPGISPSLCFDSMVEVKLLSCDEREVKLASDVFLHGDPYWVSLIASHKRARILNWSAVWPMEERWWDQNDSTKVARIQILTKEMGAMLIKAERGKWTIEGFYD